MQPAHPIFGHHWRVLVDRSVHHVVVALAVPPVEKVAEEHGADRVVGVSDPVVVRVTLKLAALNDLLRSPASPPEVAAGHHVVGLDFANQVGDQPIPIQNLRGDTSECVELRRVLDRGVRVPRHGSILLAFAIDVHGFICRRGFVATLSRQCLSVPTLGFSFCLAGRGVLGRRCSCGRCPDRCGRFARWGGRRGVRTPRA